MAQPGDRREDSPTGEELLRELLAFTMGAAQARAAAASLLNTLGSLDGVFSATREALAAIPGVGEEGARLLRLAVDLSSELLQERAWNLRRVYDTASAVEVLRPHFIGRRQETVAVLLLDSRGRAVYQATLLEGDFSSVPLKLRELLRLVIEYQCSELYLAHNHPSGMAFPSQSDLAATQKVMSALWGVGAVLCDHIIFAGDSWYSFAQGGVLAHQQELLRQAGREEMERMRRLDARIRGEEPKEKGGGSP